MSHDGALHDVLREAIERETAAAPPKVLRTAVEQLSDRYRAGSFRPRLTSVERLAYLATRLPATVAAARFVLRELAQRCPELEVRRLCDLGAGPATALLAALSLHQKVEQAVLIEADAELATIGARLLAAWPEASRVRTEWRHQDVDRARDATLGAGCDLAVASYLLGELSAAGASRVVEAAWASTGGAIAIIEPGTPAGWRRVLAARDALIRAGARIVAPCPHAGACPLAGDDWCHFAVRLNRTAQHRWLKGGSMPYEDEKFSYVIGTRSCGEPAPARIIARPAFGKRLVELRVCSPEGTRIEKVSKSSRDAYRAARHASWGGVYEGQVTGAARP